MHWSTYNTLFHSDRFGYLLYNALSNTLFELDAVYYSYLERLKESPSLISLEVNDEFWSLLRKQHVLLEDGEEERLLLEKQDRRNVVSFDSTQLGLTICPTLSCNFRCSYCFEDPVCRKGDMQPETVEQLISFIKRFERAEKLSVVWFGGEPTIGFKTICEISERIEKLDISFASAKLITNGYLLKPDRIERLNELRIKSVQITLDGPEEVHDRRRRLSSGHPTFHRIIDNVHKLMNSSYIGACSIRVNIDKTNINSFLRLRSMLLKEFEGKPLNVYPCRVETAKDHPYDHSCTLCVQEWSDFNLELYRNSGLVPVDGLFPGRHSMDLCVANRVNAYVIGPEGELYKCWEDVGNPQMVIGNIYNDQPVTRPDIVDMYRVGTDPYCDPICLDCKVLPICGGGCANRRLRAKYYHEKSLEFCSPLKNNLVAWLEEYCDSFLTADLCRKILQPGRNTKGRRGYRMIQPDCSVRPESAERVTGTN